MAKPLVEMLAKVVLLIDKVNGEAPRWYIGEGVVDDAEVGVEASALRNSSNW